MKENYCNIDVDFCDWVIPRLEALRDKGHTCPKEFSKNPKEWVSVLNEMIEGFKAYSAHSPETKEDKEKVANAFSLFAEWHAALWD